MVVRTNLYPVARGAASKKSGKRPVTFIASYYGIKDKDGFFVETTAVDCWLPGPAADILKSGMVVEALVDINGEMTIVKDFSVNGTRFLVSGKEAEAEDLPFPAEKEKSK